MKCNQRLYIWIEYCEHWNKIPFQSRSQLVYLYLFNIFLSQIINLNKSSMISIIAIWKVLHRCAISIFTSIFFRWKYFLLEFMLNLRFVHRWLCCVWFWVKLNMYNGINRVLSIAKEINLLIVNFNRSHTYRRRILYNVHIHL